jgi:hypothetical protein
MSIGMGKYDDTSFWHVDGESLQDPSMAKNEVIFPYEVYNNTFII